MKLASIAERELFRICKAASKWAQWNLFQLPNGSWFAFVKCKNTKRKNAKTQRLNCKTLIFNDIRFCIFVKSCKSTPKKPQKGRFQWQNQAFWSTKPTYLGGFLCWFIRSLCRFARRRRSWRRQGFGRRASAPSRLSRLWAEVPMRWRTWLRRRPEEEWRWCVPWVRPLRRLPCPQGGREGLWAGLQEIFVGLVSLSDLL